MPRVDIDDDLRRIAKGEVLSDEWSKKIYSVDASDHTLSPEAIIHVSDTEDVSNISKYAYMNNKPLTARGAGTGLLGQSLTTGLSLDFTKHMNNIIEIADDYVVVQPGIVKTLLDKKLQKRGKFLPPDPSSSNFCTIGGMIANNSSGMHTLGYGSTIDFLTGVEVVYYDGNVTNIFPDNNIFRDSSSLSEFYNMYKQDNRLRRLHDLLTPQILQYVNSRFPKVTKNSCGYRIDATISRYNNIFLPHKIFAASESTLGSITCARFHILDIPIYKAIIVLGFEDILKAIRTVPIILKYHPVVLELLDGSLINYNKKLIGSNSIASTTKTKTGTLLFIEFASNIFSELDSKISKCKNQLNSFGEIIEISTDDASSEKIWSARKGALNTVMKMTIGNRKPSGLIEDTIVSPHRLYDYTHFVLDMYKQHNLDYVFYGHAGNGNLHTRPIIDTRYSYHIIKKLANITFGKVVELSGSITAEHGDGLDRLYYIPFMYGEQVTNLFKNIKLIFDPYNMMNPGKKICI